jgi:hypothetical protein
MIMFGVGSLRRAIREFVEHNPLERPHQGLGNRVIKRASFPRPSIGAGIRCEEWLGGLLKHYRRAAWRWDTTPSPSTARGGVFSNPVTRDL